MNNFSISKNILFGFGIGLILLGVIFTSFYKLSESPVTWTDEGLIIQTSQNLAGQGVYGFQIAPGVFISPSFISTSYPVTFPIALSFYLFGVSLLHARIVMALYIIALFCAVCVLFRNKIKEELIWALLLLGSFPPLYGHGKNVLGEIPGLFWVLMSAIFLKSIEEDGDSLLNYCLFGLFFGLTVVTKPIFILFVPGFLFVVVRMYMCPKSIDPKKLVLLAISAFVPVLLWFSVQFFSTDSWWAILKYYSNPHSLSIVNAFILNVRDYVRHLQTIFAGGIFLLWTLVLAFLYHKKKAIPLFEIYLYILSLFVFVLYFRNPPYYRYFFISEALCLIFVPFNLFRISHGKNWLRNSVRICLILLVVFQVYQLYFNSWVASSFNSIQTKTMAEVIGGVGKSKTVFFYQAPEAVVFLPHFNYYQYFSGTTATQFGQENLGLIQSRNDLLIITKKELFLGQTKLFSGYHITKEFDRYVFATK